MQELIETIQCAAAQDATPEARAAGAEAARRLAALLEPSPASTQTAASAGPVAGIAELAAVLRGVPMDQLLDMAIVKLRAVVPAQSIPRVEPLSIPLIPVRRP